jgi:hypothetical protein
VCLLEVTRPASQQPYRAEPISYIDVLYYAQRNRLAVDSDARRVTSQRAARGVGGAWGGGVCLLEVTRPASQQPYRAEPISHIDFIVLRATESPCRR